MSRMAWTLFSLTAVAACGSDDDERPSLKVGVVLPFTGPLEIHGEPTETSVILAQKEINAAGGVLGQRIELVTLDDATDPAVGRAATQTLVEQYGVEIILGPISSSVLLEMLPYTVERNVLVLSGGPTSTAFTDYADNDLFIRTVPTVKRMAEVLADFAYQQEGSRSMVTVSAENSYNKTLADLFDARFRALGGAVNARIAVPDDPPDDRNYQADYSMVTGSTPDSVFLSTWSEYGVNFIKTALASASTLKFLGADAMSDEVTVGTELGGDAPLLKGTSFASIDNQSSRFFDELFRSALDREPTPRTREMFDATMLMALAMARAGSSGALAVRDALREVANPPGQPIHADEFARALDLLRRGEDIDYIGAAGEVNIDEHGDTQAPIKIWSFNAAGNHIVLGTVAE